MTRFDEITLTRRKMAGFTLIELGVVLAIVMLLVVVGIATMQGIRKADISTSAAKISASIRYLYDLAAINNRTYRLVFDFESSSYWGEQIDLSQTCGTAVLPSDEERKFGSDEPTIGGSEVSDSPTGGQGKLKDNLLSKRELPKGIRFMGVMTTHQDELTEDGTAEVYFFPSGYVERAFIYLERDGEVYTIETLPLRGVGVVHSKELDLRDLLDEG